MIIILRTETLFSLHISMSKDYYPACKVRTSQQLITELVQALSPGSAVIIITGAR
jgi:hypothetical protein